MAIHRSFVPPYAKVGEGWGAWQCGKEDKARGHHQVSGRRPLLRLMMPWLIIAEEFSWFNEDEFALLVEGVTGE